MGKYKKYKYNQIDHLAGIVPIGGKALDFKMPWHDSLIPVAPDYLAVEQAVYQCGIAGCKSIWVVGHKGTAAAAFVCDWMNFAASTWAARSCCSTSPASVRARFGCARFAAIASRAACVASAIGAPV